MIALFVHALFTSPARLARHGFVRAARFLQAVGEVFADADRMASEARRYGLRS